MRPCLYRSGLDLFLDLGQVGLPLNEGLGTLKPLMNTGSHLLDDTQDVPSSLGGIGHLSINLPNGYKVDVQAVNSVL